MSNELSIFEAMGGTYRKVDGILYPNISECSDNTLSVTITDVGKYGLIWISYMKENHIDRYSHHIRMGLLQRKAREHCVCGWWCLCDEAFWQNKGQKYPVCNGCEGKCHWLSLSC